MSPRPTKSMGNSRRSPKIPSRMSTYFGDAMLPRRTTSHSGPISASNARALLSSGRRYAALSGCDIGPGEGAHRLVRHQRIGTAQARVRRDDVDATADDGIVGLGRGGEPHGVGELAAEIQPAHEREHVSECRAARAIGGQPRARTAPRREDLLARVPPQLAGDNRNTLA